MFWSLYVVVERWRFRRILKQKSLQIFRPAQCKGNEIFRMLKNGDLVVYTGVTGQFVSSYIRHIDVTVELKENFGKYNPSMYAI
jgi:hypothetical protein